MRDREYRDRHKSGDCGINNTYKKGKIRRRDETKKGTIIDFSTFKQYLIGISSICSQDINEGHNNFILNMLRY